jgi:hypothetical protein
MNSQPPNLEDLRQRLTRLEEQNHRFKRLGVAGLLGIALLLVMGQAPPTKTLEANEFVLRDDGGNIRARLFVTAKKSTTMSVPGMNAPVPVTFNPKPTLALYDETGQVSGVLDDDSISFFKSHVSLSSGLLTMGDETSGLVLSRYSVGLFDEEGFETTLGRTALITPRTGESQMTSAASLVMFNKGKNVIWKAP